MNANDVIRVAIAAPTQLACTQLEAPLAESRDVCVVGAGISTALEELLGQTDPDVLVLELGTDPAQALSDVAGAVPLPPTVLIAAHAHPERALLPMRVHGVLADRLPTARLIAAVRAVAAGLIVLEASAGSGAAGEDERKPDAAGIEELTAREIEVLQLLAEGLPNKDIARALHISEHTVKYHLAAVFGKLGSTNRTEAVAIGIRRGLVMI